jgi:hypothetical protein
MRHGTQAIEQRGVAWHRTQGQRSDRIRVKAQRFPDENLFLPELPQWEKSLTAEQRGGLPDEVRVLLEVANPKDKLLARLLQPAEILI